MLGKTCRTPLLALLALVSGLALGLILDAGSIHSEPRMDFQRFHQLLEERFGAQRLRVSHDWEKMLEEVAKLPDDQKVRHVSRFFHRHLRYETDIRLWGKEDYWATPLETLGMGRGDCEDWAIAKYFSLRLLGIDDRHLRLIYVRAGPRTGSGGEPHMVLGYYPDPAGEPLILDNMIRDVLPASRRTDLIPVFSFNSQGLFVGLRSTPSGPSSARLSHWREVLDRVRREGMHFE
ncbi:MAG: transglutaminase [Desulfovibrionales bacterium]|nr:MAG: transglutaminase [Desulfovibrionales bacterium]